MENKIKIAEPLDFDTCPMHSPRYDELMGSIHIIQPRHNGKSITSAKEVIDATLELNKLCNSIEWHKKYITKEDLDEEFMKAFFYLINSKS